MAASESRPAPEWGSVLLTERAKAHFEEYFLPRYKKMLEAIDKTELTVLLWGPGSTDTEFYTKRLQIRDELRRSGITALTSEEICKETDLNDYSLLSQELAQAKLADLVILIQASAGSTGEAHDFSRLRSLAGKLLVFVDELAIEGYSYKALLAEMNSRLNNVTCYSNPKDIKECHLLTAVTKQVRYLREVKWYRDHE
jgi:hypothetical protein